MEKLKSGRGATHDQSGVDNTKKKTKRRNVL